MSADGPLDLLLESISDGDPVDWARAEAGAGNGAERARVGALREVHRIVQFNRALQRTSGVVDILAAADGPTRWGPLTLLDRIGSGTSGSVYRAWDATLEREVALKFLDAAGVAGGDAAPLLEEARALARIRHPGVVGVHGIATHDGRTGLWMEYLKGRSLAAEIERDGALGAERVARIGREVAEALDAVNAAGVVHRDLKPANIQLVPEGRAVLTDFGLGIRPGTLAHEAARASGTPVFMAPELLEGGPATHRSDLYALGVTLRWALTGRPPFRARSLEELKREAATGPAVPLAVEAPGAPAPLVRAIERLMAADPAARFGSAAAFGAALTGAGVLSGVALPSGATTSARPRRPLILLVAAAALVAVVLGALRFAPGRLTGLPETGGMTAAEAPAASSNASTTPDASGAGDPAGVVAPWTVEAALIGRSGAETRRLAPGDRIRPGDRLSLEFRSSRRMWVYVLNEDERGETYLLFPQPRFDTANPLPADTTLRLPGPIGGAENAWTVTSRGGREHFLIVAGTEPLPEIEAELAQLPAAAPDRAVRYARVGAATVERLRGVGGLAPLPATPTPRRAGAFERFEALAGRETVSAPLWVRRITLANP